MGFDVPADDYTAFMGRWSTPLSPKFLAFAGVRRGDRVVDVGCGPGVLTALLVERQGADHVAAIDPSAPFVKAARERFAEVDVHEGVAEQLPFDDHAFDAALAQLVVPFMPDPAAGLAEMARVTRPGGTVAACQWDHDHLEGPISVFLRAVAEVDPAGAERVTARPERRTRDLAGLFETAGLTDLAETTLEVTIEMASVDAYLDPFLLGVGPIADYTETLDDETSAELRRACARLLPHLPGPLTSTAQAVRGVTRRTATR